MQRDMETKLILFGAGVYAKKYKALLEYLQINFDCFTDNDSTKWGTKLYGKMVISPEKLVDLGKCQIIISSTHEAAIRKQLTELGLLEYIIELQDLYRLCEKQDVSERVRKFSEMGVRCVLVDMYEGIGWGGSEIWAAHLAYGLQVAGERTMLIGGVEQSRLEEPYENLVHRVPETETIRHMVDFMEANLPCVFINNFAGCGFMAAIILKKKYPNLVKIISVIHNDNRSLFDAHMMLVEYIDKIFCVSNQIKEHMWKLYPFERGRYYFKEQPIVTDSTWEKSWNLSQTIKIGYAARLVRQQKRADLLINLLQYLEEEEIDYVFSIAGEGECMEKLKGYVQTYNLTSKVRLLGRLPKSEMDAFWKEQDVFVNLSEYEGTCLSMLEAMSFGCVPTVTDVSGVREFIHPGENGFIAEVGDIQQIAEYIKLLDENREMLLYFGSKNEKIIKERCNPQRYIDFWREEVLVL